MYSTGSGFRDTVILKENLAVKIPNAFFITGLKTILKYTLFSR